MFKKIGEKVYNFVNKHSEFIFVLVGLGLVCALAVHYGIMGFFNLKWFLFFELPIYLFCIYQVIKIFKR